MKTILVPIDFSPHSPRKRGHFPQIKVSTRLVVGRAYAIALAHRDRGSLNGYFTTA